MNFKIEYDHEKFLEICLDEKNAYMIENIIIECLKEVYHPEVTPESSEENIVPWFWSHGAIPLLVKIERFFSIYFPKEETPLFCGQTGNEFVTIVEFAKIIQKKLSDTKAGTAAERPPSRRRGN